MHKSHHCVCHRAGILAFSDCEQYVYAETGIQEQSLEVRSKHPVFPCDQCSKKYARNRDLLRHKSATHSEGYPLKCPDCGKGYSKIGFLTRHRETVHGKEPPAASDVPKDVEDPKEPVQPQKTEQEPMDTTGGEMALPVHPVEGKVLGFVKRETWAWVEFFVLFCHSACFHTKLDQQCSLEDSCLWRLFGSPYLRTVTFYGHSGDCQLRQAWDIKFAKFRNILSLKHVARRLGYFENLHMFDGNQLAMRACNDAKVQ